MLNNEFIRLDSRRGQNCLCTSVVKQHMKLTETVHDYLVKDVNMIGSRRYSLKSEIKVPSSNVIVLGTSYRRQHPTVMCCVSKPESWSGTINAQSDLPDMTKQKLCKSGQRCNEPSKSVLAKSVSSGKILNKVLGILLTVSGILLIIKHK